MVEMVWDEAKNSQMLHFSCGSVYWYRVYDPKLTLCGQDIPFIGNTTFRFLGAPVSVHNIHEKVRSDIVTKLESMLSQVDATLVTCRQKLRLYRDAICPRLT